MRMIIILRYALLIQKLIVYLSFMKRPLLLWFGTYYITIPRPLESRIYTIPRPP